MKRKPRQRAPLIRPADGWIYVSPQSGKHVHSYVSAIDEVTTFEAGADGCDHVHTTYRTGDPLYSYDNGEAAVLIAAIRPMVERLIQIARGRKGKA